MTTRVKQVLSLFILGLLAALIAALSMWLMTRNEVTLNGTALEHPIDVSGVSLTGAAGQSVKIGDFKGKIVLAFFGYTHCPDVCPLTMGKLDKVYRDLGSPADLQVILMTVDPARDTPEITDRYAKNYNTSFIGLSGGTSAIAKAARTFLAGYQELPAKDVQHTDYVALVDREGQMRVVYRQDNVPLLAEDLPALLKARAF